MDFYLVPYKRTSCGGPCKKVYYVRFESERKEFPSVRRKQ